VAVAECTDRFSFAYLKELFLSAMMEWIGDQGSGQASGRMSDALLERAAFLREQLSEVSEETPNPSLDKAMTAAPLHGKW